VRLISVAMMRDGAKLASYRVLADALRRLEALPWDLVLVGDGPARGDVEAAFAPLSPRVRFAGACSSADVARLMHDADVYAWPAVDEAFGMTFLEAQACGLPVVAGAANGVAAVVAHGHGGWLVAPRDAAAIAEALRKMIVDAHWRERMGREARDNVREHHDLASAAERLDRFLARVCDAARATSV
jgi:glycosyltransferase involved in cell wall biosynthesis